MSRRITAAFFNVILILNKRRFNFIDVKYLIC